VYLRRPPVAKPQVHVSQEPHGAGQNSSNDWVIKSKPNSCLLIPIKPFYYLTLFPLPCTTIDL
jgi:hypothetical protein